MQRCRCEKYQDYAGVDCPSGFHLCSMCATSVAGGTSRYSWNACEVCLKFNRKFEKEFGGSLPLGRHSMMNGVGIPLSASAEVQELATKKLLQFVHITGSISDWETLQSRLLFESVPEWERELYVKQSVWEKKFKLSASRAMARSEQAFKDYLRVNSFEELSG